MTSPDEVPGQLELFDDMPSHLGRVKITAGFEDGATSYIDVVLYEKGISARTINAIMAALATGKESQRPVKFRLVQE